MTIDPGDDQFQFEPKPVERRPGYRLIHYGAVGFGVLCVVVIAALIGRSGDTPASSTGPSGAADLGAPTSTVTSALPGSTRFATGPSAPAISEAASPSTPPVSPQSNITAQPSKDALPAFADIALQGSPEMVVFQRVGDDINVLGWRPGEPGLATKQTILAAARGLTAYQSLQTELSPNGSMLLVHAGPAIVDGPDTFRVFRLEAAGGREIWHSTSLGSGLVAAFAPTGQLVVTSGAPMLRDRGWTIVDVSGDKAVVHEIDLRPMPTPAPSASVALGTATYYYLPLALSADGRWLYAMSAHAAQPLYRPAYRISVATGRAQPIDAFPITGIARIVSAVIDPISGRFVSAGPASGSSSAGYVEAWSPGAETPDFHVDLRVVFGAVWTDNGTIITAEYDRVPGPFSFRVLPISATGTVGSALLTAAGDNAALVGVRNGFAAAYVAWTATGERELAVIRLSDGATSGVHVSDPDGLSFNLGMRP